MTEDNSRAAPLEAAALKARYQHEREKRAVAGRAEIRDLQGDDAFARYRRDPFTPFRERNAVGEDVNVAIVGAGMAGIVLAARLREQGVSNIRLFDEAGGFGGTWYWNRYPGVMCDIESYIYMPMLEELGYIPKNRYAFGDEIREHFEAIARQYELGPSTLFHTRVMRSEWDEAAGHWVISTDRGDEIRARVLIMAVGILNLMKLPAIPGMEQFEGHAFHTARWDYDYTGGSATDWHDLSRLGDKRVAVVGTGASAVQCVPPLAESAEHLYVFQRTPSAIGFRGNRPTDPTFADDLKPGWQTERMENFARQMLAQPVEQDLTDDGWTQHYAPLITPRVAPGTPVDEIMNQIEEIDRSVMDEHRARVDQLVSDPEKAETLKPWYHYLCKRPCFHDEYLPTFNRENVTLVDCPSGVERITRRGIVANGVEYEVDCVIYATGFEGESASLSRRAGHPIIGRRGLDLGEKWRDGVQSLHGLMTRGFPNFFAMPAPYQQAVVTVTQSHITVEGADHIARTIAALLHAGIDVFDVSKVAEQAWTEAVASRAVDRSAQIESCTPSRLNFEGDPSLANPKNGSYGGGGPGDFFGYRDVLSAWREAGDFDGLEVDRR